MSRSIAALPAETSFTDGIVETKRSLPDRAMSSRAESAASATEQKRSWPTPLPARASLVRRHGWPSTRRAALLCVVLNDSEPASRHGARSAKKATASDAADRAVGG